MRPQAIQIRRPQRSTACCESPVNISCFSILKKKLSKTVSRGGHAAHADRRHLSARTSLGRPSLAQDLPKTAQEPPKSRPRAPKTAQELSKTPQDP